jgi:hypothetical protein
MAARNIRTFSMSMAMNNDERPIQFRGPVKATTPTINAEKPPTGEGTRLAGKTRRLVQVKKWLRNFGKYL